MAVSLKKFQFLTNSSDYSQRHRKSQTSFTRQRKLPFMRVLKFLLSKSVKSLQSRLNEWGELLDEQISSSALCQARQKFSHSAFIELLEECVVKVMYGDGDYEKYKNYRLLAIDGSTLRLPKSKETLKVFGQSRKGDETLVESKLSVVYDVLNRIPITAILHPGRTNDIVACQEQLSFVGSNDIVIADRGYDSYAFFAAILEQKADFVIRCQAKRKVCRMLLEDDKQKDITVVLEAPEYKKKFDEALSSTLPVRFIRIPLPNGEVEVLATSLISKSKFPYKEFKKLYAARWKVETYFQVLKSRLGLDNFSGKTEEAILQDLHASIFVSGLGTILTEEANEELGQKDTKYPQKVNNSIVFHAIKNRIIALMFENPPDFQEQMKNLFLQNPTLIRAKRVKERNYNATTAGGKARSFFFQKHIERIQQTDHLKDRKNKPRSKSILSPLCLTNHLK